jgi:hypothetical protein
LGIGVHRQKLAFGWVELKTDLTHELRQATE